MGGVGEVEMRSRVGWRRWSVGVATAMRGNTRRNGCVESAAAAAAGREGVQRVDFCRARRAKAAGN